MHTKSLGALHWKHSLRLFPFHPEFLDLLRLDLLLQEKKKKIKWTHKHTEFEVSEVSCEKFMWEVQTHEGK